MSITYIHKQTTHEITYQIIIRTIHHNLLPSQSMTMYYRIVTKINNDNNKYKNNINITNNGTSHDNNH